MLNMQFHQRLVAISNAEIRRQSDPQGTNDGDCLHERGSQGLPSGMISLPLKLRQSTNLEKFKIDLKTHLY